MCDKFSVGGLCGFGVSSVAVQDSERDYTVLDLRYAVGRVDRVLGGSVNVYVRSGGRDYVLEFPVGMLHAVIDNLINRLKVSDLVCLGEDGYYRFADGSMYDKDGKRYPGLWGQVFDGILNVRKPMVAPDPLSGFRIVFGKEDGKKPMSKERCIRLLERYHAERDKTERGRGFDLVLKKGVVDEAIVRAIELLKSGE